MPVLLKFLLPKPGTTYPPTEPALVNSSTPNKIENEHFEGEISMWIKDYNGLKNGGEEDLYFGQPGREGSTYALVVKGKHLGPISANDLLFGNVFEKPIRSSLPWGTSIAMKFINWVDPTVEMDPYSDKPWALSPLLASMNYLSVKPASEPVDSKKTITEDSHSGIDTMWKNSAEGKQDSQSEEPQEWETGTAAGISARRRWLTKKENREELIVDKDWQFGCEFGNGLIDFKTLHVVLPHPFPLRIPLLKYWDGQPAIYICKSRDGKKIFWSMAIQIEAVDDTDYVSAKEDVVAENDEVKGAVEESEEKGRPEVGGGLGKKPEELNDDVD
ncbi:hypothetical protein HD553DRAFT_311278 [Filobasidium floriforme]|uniref:uncharacterized protein n=1 Tax=Filobasidium floriforme TaxID=5210 RepID=UPI001E8E2C74|nr:uncharacterized protein HD553DRAFT_311278 [Filobasidium floriforme]KAH8084603.1 hypothetical protein HD553DRAFT_311278 [Filobasidium floriforme]